VRSAYANYLEQVKPGSLSNILDINLMNEKDEEAAWQVKKK